VKKAEPLAYCKQHPVITMELLAVLTFRK